MTSSDRGSVSYHCPRCKAALTAEADDAGRRRECPHCGKMVKVPGTPSATAARGPDVRDPAAPTPTPTVEQGIANIAVICPLCGTRMYATRQQAGQTMVCPDCLESVTIPASAATNRPAPSTVRKPPSRSIPPAKPPAPAPTDARDDADDEIKLSDPVEIPAERVLPKKLTDMLREADAEAAASSSSPADAAPPSSSGSPASSPSPRPQAPPALTPPSARPAAPAEFAVKCPTCDTMLYATENEVGKQLKCPDCNSIVTVTRPRPKPKRVNDVVDADYEGQLFTLSEPVSLDIYHRTEAGLTPKTLGEDALRKAEEEYDRRRQQEPDLPPIPLWDGLFRFLPHAPIIARLVVSGVLLGCVPLLLFAVAQWFQGKGTVVFAAIFGTALLIALVVITAAFLSVNCLVILTESANGRDEMTDWPEFSLMEWLGESLSVALPVFMALAPGLVVFLFTGTLGMPLGTRWLFIGISIYMFLPIAQLSVLESSSLVTPVSQAIVKSLSTDFLLWATFYMMTLAIALIVALTLSVLRPDLSTVVLLLFGFIWSLAMFMYYRLLGRLVWACQERLLTKEDEKEEQEKPS